MHEGKNEEETQKCKEDIELVRELVEKQKEAPAEKGEGLTDTQKTAIDFVLSLPPEKLKKFIKLAQAVFEDEQHD